MCLLHICACWVASVMSNSLRPPWIVARQAPLSMGFSKQDPWSGFPCPPPGDLPDSGIKPRCPVLAGGFFTIWTTREAPFILAAPLNWNLPHFTSQEPPMWVAASLPSTALPLLSSRAPALETSFPEPFIPCLLTSKPSLMLFPSLTMLFSPPPGNNLSLRHHCLLPESIPEHHPTSSLLQVGWSLSLKFLEQVAPS